MQITELYKQINRENSFEKMNFESLHREMYLNLGTILPAFPTTGTKLFLISNYMLDEYNSLKEENERLKNGETE